MAAGIAIMAQRRCEASAALNKRRRGVLAAAASA